MDKKQIEIQPPNISIDTQKRMHAFFMKTSAPMIYAEMKRIEEVGGRTIDEQIKVMLNNNENSK